MKYRVGQGKTQLKHFDKVDASSVITRIKIMARLDIAERKRAQEGKIELKIGGTAYRLEVKTSVQDGREVVIIGVAKIGEVGPPDQQGEEVF